MVAMVSMSRLMDEAETREEKKEKEKEEMEKDKGHPTRPYHITNPHKHTKPYNVNDSLEIKFIGKTEENIIGKYH